MNWKSIAFLLALVLAAAASAAPTLSVTPALVSQYMFRGERRGGPAFEPNIEFDSGALALGLWTNFPLKDKVAGQSDPELDPYGSYTFDLVKDKLTLQPGFTLYTYPTAKKKDGFDQATFEPSLALNYTVAGVRLTPRIYRDLALKQSLFEFSAACALPLARTGTELDLLATAGTFKAADALSNHAPAVRHWGNYWQAGATLPFAIPGAGTLSLGWAYTRGANNFLKQGSAPKIRNPTAVGRGVVTVSYAITF